MLNSQVVPNISDDIPVSGFHPTPERALPWHIARKQWIPKAISKVLLGKPMAPTETEWEQVKLALWQGDDAMDQLVAWMFDSSPKQGKALFDQALKQGIDAVQDAPEELKAFFHHVDTDPHWLDRDLLERGIRASHLSGNVAFFVLRDMALMGGYAYFNSLNQTLALTGALRKETSLRLGETGKWLNDVTEPGGLDRYGPGFATTLRVRMVHALVRRNLSSKPQWQSEKWGLPINQMDMLATYLAFGPVTISGVRLFGVPVSRKESAAIMHMWRYVGWLLGVDEQWLALTERDGLRKLYHTFLTHSQPDEKIRQLGSALQQEPLTRSLPGWESKPIMAKLIRRFIYQQHLSNSSLILGPVQRKQLGIPFYAVPWYPLLSAPLRFGTQSYYRLRGGKALQAYRVSSRERQQRLLDSYFGDKPKDIIQPAKDHPAHVG
jgi:hypothetical protein